MVTCTRNKRALTWVVAPTTAPPKTVASAPPITAGFDGKVIRVGVLTTKTHPVWGQIGKTLLAPMESRVAAINKRGGIAGKYPIELVTLETNYDAGLTVAQLNASRDRVVGYASILGTPNIEAALPELRAQNLLAVPASQDARWASEPTLLPIANSYQIQAINGIAYYLETSGNPKATVCSVSVATSFGDTGIEGFQYAQQQLGFSAGPVIKLDPTDNNVGPALGQLRAAGCSAVLVTTGPVQTVGLVTGGAQIGFGPRWLLMGPSFSERISTPQTGPVFERSAWVLGDGSQWGDPSTPGMAELSAELIATGNRVWTENPDTGLTYGWIQAKVFEAVLERAVVRADLSHAGLVAAAKEIGTVDTRGLSAPVNYNVSPRLSDAKTTIFAVDNSYRNAIRVVARAYQHPSAAAYRRP